MHKVLKSVGAACVATVAIGVLSVDAQACEAPLGFTAPQAPDPAPMDDLVKLVETIEIAVARDQLVSDADQLPLPDLIDPKSPLPQVTGTQVLTTGPYGDEGSRRIVCSEDGSTRLEHVLERERSENSDRVLYQIWENDSKSARAVEYAVGEVVVTSLSPTRTEIIWTTGFSLREDEVEGALGRIGKWLFRRNYVEDSYQAHMAGTLAHIKTSLESGPTN